jgi:hypothetical protein
MAGAILGLYRKDSILYFRRPNENETFVPLTTEECEVVHTAMRSAHLANLERLNTTGNIDFDGDNRAVKQAAQDALVDFLNRPPPGPTDD